MFSATRHVGFNDGMLWDPPESEAELKKPLEDGIAAWAKGEVFTFSIDAKEDGRFLGRIGIRKGEEDGVWNIGFWIHPDSQGNGFMTEAAQAILRFGFEELGAVRIEACYALWNKASGRVLEKVGMNFVRYIPKGFLKKGEWVEENLMAIDLSDWKPLNQSTLRLV